MASVLIITTILNIVVSVVVSSEKQSSQFSPNKPLVQNDKKEVDRRTDTDSWGNQVKLDQLKSDKHENPSSLDRKKRQILFLVNRRPAPDALLRIPKSTQNPFIRETNVDEYDIGGPDDIEHIPQASDSGSHVTSHQQVRMAQDIINFYQIIKAKIELSSKVPIENIKTDIKAEDSHVRIKRKMSEFRRDRKQITRKKKIGRRKKTKVRRLPVKDRKWYDKRQKVAKKGDGTYRGGRGRIPRQHKRPRHYKPPKNESSVYDYYDDNGKVKVAPGETQEGSEAAEYVEYGTGEYADTAEADAAQQELEKEYQMQLVRERKRVLMNGTVNNDESMFEHSNESEYNATYTDSGDYGSEYDTEYEDDETDEEASDDTSSDDRNGPEKNRKTRDKRQVDKEINDVRLIAKRLNLMSLSNNPSAHNRINTNQVPGKNRMSSIQFAQPTQNQLQTIQSIHQEHAPDIVSMRKSEITSMGGTEMHNLQSKSSSVDIGTASRGAQVTSIAGDKPETAMVFTSSKDSRRKITSIGQEHFRGLQSIAVDPLVLTSAAKYIPDFSKEKASSNRAEKKVAEEQVEGVKRNRFLSHGGNEQVYLGTRKKGDTRNNLVKMTMMNRRFIKTSPISKQQFSGSYEELSSVPDGVGTSVQSDEIESADDK